MKKIIFLSMILFAFGMIAKAQTNYSPLIMSQDIPYPNSPGDTTHIKVYQTMLAWNDVEMQIRLVRQITVTRTDTTYPVAIHKETFHHVMADSITHVRDNLNEVSNTGRGFTEIIFDNGGAINWPLWKELGRSFYFTRWDVNEYYLIRDQVTLY